MRRRRDTLALACVRRKGLLMLAFGVLLCATAHAECWSAESWQRAALHEGEPLTMGEHSVYWSANDGYLHSREPLLELLPADEGVWVLQTDGSWRFGDSTGWLQSWDTGHRIAANEVAIVTEPGLHNCRTAPLIWQIVGEELWQIQLSTHPCVIQSQRLPVTALGPKKLFLHDNELWVSIRTKLYKREGVHWSLRDRLPTADCEWCITDAGLVIHCNGELSGAGAADLPRSVRKWCQPCGEVWFQRSAGEWYQLCASGSVRRIVLPAWRDTHEEEWTPLGVGLWLNQDQLQQSLWAESNGSWTPVLDPHRDFLLRDRLLRYTSRWLLSTEGDLLCDTGDGYQFLEHIPGATSLHSSGPGALVLGEQGLCLFSDDGLQLGTAPRAGMQAACSLEDHLLSCDTDSLYCWWTQEDVPQLQASIALQDLWALRAGGDYLVAASGTGLMLINIAPPWEAELLDTMPMPPDCADWIVIDDHLILAETSTISLWSLAGGRFSEVPPGYPRVPAASVCRRGADRLLALSTEGVLHQLLLFASEPVSVDWSLALETSGRISVRGDSLRVLNEGGVLDLPLPPLVQRHRGGEPEFQACYGLRRGQSLLWRSADSPSLEVYDLLGRRLDVIQAYQGQRLPLPSSMAAGHYLLRSQRGEVQRLLIMP